MPSMSSPSPAPGMLTASGAPGLVPRSNPSPSAGSIFHVNPAGNTLGDPTPITATGGMTVPSLNSTGPNLNQGNPYGLSKLGMSGTRQLNLE